jgi:hypothetical protein
MATGALILPPGYTALNVSASANLYTGKCYVSQIIVATGGTAACSIIDSTGTSATAANTVWTSPATTTAGTCYLNGPIRCYNGISAVIAGGAVLTVTYGDLADD